jgi:hypothetical protein
VAADSPDVTLTSLASSTRVDLATGISTTQAHAFAGLPVAGFSVRTLVNGNLTCGSAVCQGNYGSAYPLRFQRRISP